MADEQANSLSERFNNWAFSFVKGSAPGQRTFYCAYAELETQKGEDIGTFVLGLYQLAKAPGGLRVQKFQEAFIARKLEADKKYKFNPKDLLNDKDAVLVELLHKFYPKKDGKNLEHTLNKIHRTLYHSAAKGKPVVAKTAFELALLQTNNREQIQHDLRAEYAWQQENGLLPQEVYRAQIGDWLGNLSKTNYRIKQDGVKELSVTMDNPRPKKLENIIHYMMGWVAFVATASSVVMAVAALTANPLVAIAAGIATFIAFDAANLFDTFDYGEWFWKDGRWLATRNFTNPGEIDPLKLLKSSLMLAAIGFVAYSGASALFNATLAFPGVAQLGANVAQGIAGVVASWSFATTVIGLSIPLRFLKGLSIKNNQVDPKQIPNDLPILQLNPDQTKNHAKLDALKQAMRESGKTVEFFDSTNPRNILIRPLQAAEPANDDAAPAPTRSSRRKTAKL